MRPLFIVATCVLVAAIVAPLALAETVQEAERREYKVQVEPICQQNAEQSEDILDGARKKVKEGKLPPAGRQFIRAAAALRKTLAKLKPVPKPPSYEAKLTEWLDRVDDQATLLQEIGKALKERKRRRIDVLVTKLKTGAQLTNALVVPFSFHYCRLKETL